MYKYYGEATNVNAAGTHLSDYATHIQCRSEGFPNGIFHPCPLWARAVARWKNCRRVVVVAVVGVIWKMHQI